MEIISNFNYTLFVKLYLLTTSSPLLSKIAVFIAGPFGILLVLSVVFFLLVHRDVQIGTFTRLSRLKIRLLEVSTFILVGSAAWGSASLLKILLGVPRPFMILTWITPLITVHDFYGSFPSGHATTFAALAVLVGRYHPAIGIFLGCSAFLIGVSRIAVGVHSPIDVLGGFILGILIAYSGERVIRGILMHRT